MLMEIKEKSTDKKDRAQEKLIVGFGKGCLCKSWLAAAFKEFRL